MQNIQNLYKALFQSELLTIKFEDFLKKYENENYKRNVFTVASEKGLFTKSYSDFEKAYSLPKQEQPQEYQGGAWQNIQDNLANAGEMAEDVLEFWGIKQKERSVEEAAEKGNLGAYSGLSIASSLLWERAFGRTKMKEWKEQAPSFFSTYNPSDSETFQKVIENFEIEKQQTKQTMTFKEADSVGDYLSVIGGAIANVGGSVAYNLGTLGTGFFMEFAAENFITANEAKAEGEGKTLEQLLKDNEADVDSPFKIAAFQSGLEYLGFKKIMKPLKGTKAGKEYSKYVGKFLTDKYKKSKNVRVGLDILSTGATEAFTEMGQTGLEIYNRELAEAKANDKEINDLLSITKGMFSPEGIELSLIHI